MTQATQLEIHPFERAGLGLAPFRFVGVNERYTTCDYCGTPIRWQYWICSEDGREFGVGCECVRKTTPAADSLLISVEKAAKKLRSDATRAKKAAKVAAQAAKVAAQVEINKEAYAKILAATENSTDGFLQSIRQQILSGRTLSDRQVAAATSAVESRKNQAETNKVKYAGLLEAIEGIESDFIESIRQQILSGWQLSDKQMQAVRRILESKQAPKAYLGPVGSKVAVQGEVISVRDLGAFAYKAPVSRLYLIKTRGGELASYLGTVCLGPVGSILDIVATVKEHRVESDGRYVTSVTRPKVG